MKIRTPLVAAGAALLLAVPGLANAAGRHHTHVTKVTTGQHNSRVLATPAGATIYMPATATSPPTYVNVNACELTDACAPAVNADSAPPDALS